MLCAAKAFFPIQNLCQQKSFLSEFKILERTNNARANPFEIYVQIMIIRFTMNWMMKSKQVRWNAWRIVLLKQYHAWPSYPG